MKKTFLLFVSLMLCFLLTACDPGSYSFSYDELSDNVISVELINYKNSDQKAFFSWVPDHSSDLLPFDNSNVRVLEKLNDDKISDFLMQFSQADILPEYYVFNSPRGICIKLTYSDGDFLIISCDYEKKSYSGYIGRYSSNGEVEEFIGSFSSYDYFESLVNNFFEIEI